MPLALVIFALGAQIWMKLRHATAWTRSDRVVVCALLTSGMLIKGPIVLAFLLPGLVLLRSLGQRGAWCGWWPWLAATGIFLLWLTGGILTTPEFFENVVLREFAGRFEGTHRAQPLYFYLPHLLYRFAPWSLLLIGFGIAAGRKKAGAMTPATRWLICWVAGALLVMSLVPSKRPDRIFPLVPSLCLLLASQFAHIQSWRTARRAAVFALALGCMMAAGYVATRVVGGYRAHRDAFVSFGRQVREATSQRALSYEVIGGADEGLLLYLRKLNFTQFADAVDDLRLGKIGALVLPETQLASLERRLPDVRPLFTSGAAGPYANRYTLVVRAPHAGE
jgi:4-amino-4-deoxy-L-arabinose transferase-like glycosyltransferase